MISLLPLTNNINKSVPQGTETIPKRLVVPVAVPNVALAEVAEVEAEAVTSSVADVAEAEVIISGGTTMTSMCSLQSGPETS